MFQYIECLDSFAMMFKSKNCSLKGGIIFRDINVVISSSSLYICSSQEIKGYSGGKTLNIHKKGRILL